MNKQLEYLTPEVNVFTVQTEGVICTSGDIGINGFGDDPNELSGFVGL